MFTRLLSQIPREADDTLFIGFSHVVPMDSDVLYECLHILPDHRPGVPIRFHDIFTPLDYREKFVMTNLCSWGEQFWLEASLPFNSAFTVLWPSSAVPGFTCPFEESERWNLLEENAT